MELFEDIKAKLDQCGEMATTSVAKVATVARVKRKVPLSLSCSEMLHVILKSLVCTKYFTIRLAEAMSLAFGRLNSLDSTLKAYHTSNLTVIAA